jgi:hypothetical protein
MSRLVLNLGNKSEFPPEPGSKRDPLPFRQLPYDLAVGMLTDHPDEIVPVFLRHPIAGFNFVAFGDAVFEFGEELIR